MMRSIFCFFDVLGLGVVGVCNAGAAASPNIVVILVDDLGYGDLSSYGAPDLKSPNIDRLIGQGMRLTNAYANCPVCSPTRAALLTGRYPDRVGVPGVIRTHAANNWGFLDPAAITLAQQLKPAGYHTAIIGKWHLGLESPNTPNERGFDFFHGFLGDMMDDYYKHRRHGVNYMRRNAETIEPEGHATDLFTDWAVDYITEQSKTESPFFLYLAYNAPHTPIQPPNDWLAKVKTREPNMSEKRAKLVALIEHLDAGIGRVMEAIDRAGIAKDTLVVFASDNGGQTNVGANNGPWRGAKQEMYEGGLRVPMGVVWPGRIAAGSSTDLKVLSMDLYPTLCTAAGVKVEHAIEGLDFLPTLTGGPVQDFDRDLFWVRREGGHLYQGQDYHAMQRGPWKLLHNTPFLPLELYHLGDDPQEKNDLSKKQPKQFKAMAAALQAHIQQGGRVPWQKP